MTSRINGEETGMYMKDSGDVFNKRGSTYELDAGSWEGLVKSLIQCEANSWT